MKRPILLRACALVCVLAVTPCLRADDYEALKPLIQKGLESAGGRDKLSLLKGTSSRVSGTYHGMGGPAPFSGRYVAQQPDRVRIDIENVYLAVVNGDAGWLKSNGAVTDLSREQIDDARQDLHSNHVATLLPLGDSKYRITRIGEASVNGQAAVGFRVERENYRTVELYLDKDSGLVLKRSEQQRSTEKGGQLVQQETLYSAYQTVNGVKVATKSVASRDGEKYLEMEHSDIQRSEKIDDSEFQRP